MTSTAPDLGTLYKVRKGQFKVIDVPELGYLMIQGRGAPEGLEFEAAVQALYTVSHGVYFALKKEQGSALRVMPLEALWWVDDLDLTTLLDTIALGRVTTVDVDRWRWQAMIAQPDRADAAAVTHATEQAREKRDLPALDRLRYVRWAEGSCGQMLHIGPYATEGPSIVRLYQAIAAAGYRPCGRHHEIYLGDSQRTAPDRLRTILRLPIEPIPTEQNRDPHG